MPRTGESERTPKFRPWFRVPQMEDKTPGLRKFVSARGMLCGVVHVHDVEDTTVDKPCANTKDLLADDAQKRRCPYLRTQSAWRDLTATSVQAKEKASTAALKLKNSTLLKYCFLVKQYIPLGR